MTAIVRTLIVALIVGGSTLGIYWHFRTDWQNATIRDLEARNAEMEARVQARDTMIRRLSRTRRLAHIEVTNQTRDAGGEIAETEAIFIELDDDGTELGRQTVRVPGEYLFVDAWTVRFDPAHVASGHPLFGRSLVLFRRIYSDQIAPRDGVQLDVPGAVPPGYAAGDAGQFEKQVWDDFWRIATDSAVATAMQVRVAQGEVVYKPVRAGQRYELAVDANGGMSFTPLPATTTTSATLSHIDG